MRAFILALGLMATPAMAADQFDLVCQGGPTIVRYRIDLVSGEACSDQCGEIWKMGVPTTGELKIIDRSPVYRGDLEERSIVNRQTGAWHYYTAIAGKVYPRDGKCDLAPFSGFPTAKF